MVLEVPKILSSQEVKALLDGPYAKRVKKRRRPVDLDESDVVYLLKEMLNAVFSDTLMRWKSGEKTSDATKRSKKANSTAADSRRTVIKNLMGRRSDLIAYNQKKVPVCLCEVKDGCSSTESTRQESKSIRCTKSLQLYNAVINGSDSIWSLDMNGKVQEKNERKYAVI